MSDWRAGTSAMVAARTAIGRSPEALSKPTIFLERLRLRSLLRAHLLNSHFAPVAPRISALPAGAQAPRMRDSSRVARAADGHSAVVVANASLDALFVMPADRSGTHGV